MTSDSNAITLSSGLFFFFFEEENKAAECAAAGVKSLRRTQRRARLAESASIGVNND